MNSYEIKQSGYYDTWQIHTARGTVIGYFTTEEKAREYVHSFLVPVTA